MISTQLIGQFLARVEQLPTSCINNDRSTKPFVYGNSFADYYSVDLFSPLRSISVNRTTSHHMRPQDFAHLAEL